MFYDSLEGNCKDWVKGLPTDFIDSIIRLWDIFLKTWTTKLEFVAGYILHVPFILNSSKQQSDDSI
jgi:hypothetical protein